MLDALKNIVGSVAPVLGNMLGGPLGGAAVSALSNYFLGRPDGSQEEVFKAIQNATPDQIIQMKRIENELILEMRKADIEEEKIHASDRASARDRQQKIEAATGSKDYTLIGIAYITIIGFFIVMFSLFLLDINGSVRDVAIAMTGVLGAKFGSIIDYFFGSSSGSKQKDIMLSRK